MKMVYIVLGEGQFHSKILGVFDSKEKAVRLWEIYQYEEEHDFDFMKIVFQYVQ